MINWDRKKQVDIAVLDFAKAFDTVPQDRLLGRLQHYGIDNNIHAWISSFLKGRTQSVVLDGVKSKEIIVESGVPQGTVLGPLLFLAHINDLPECVSSHVRLFADDCLMYRCIESTRDQQALQQDLVNLEEWGNKWGMRFNTSKCEIMRIHRGCTPYTRMYTIGDEVLKEVGRAKYLGVTISNDLSWSPHISSVAGKANAKIGFLWRNLQHCPPKLREQAYFALVRLVIEYGAAVWDPYLKKDINSLENVQRRAARFVMHDNQWTSSVSEMIDRLGWTSLADRRKNIRLALFYKAVHGIAALSTDGVLL